MNANGCHFFCMEEFSSTPLLHPHFHVRRNFVRLSLCCHLSHGNKIWWNTGGKVQPLLPYHQYPPLMVWTNTIKYEALLPEQPLSLLLFLVIWVALNSLWFNKNTVLIPENQQMIEKENKERICQGVWEEGNKQCVCREIQQIKNVSFEEHMWL